jgi:Domain of unknown function (DUF4259)
MGAWSHEPFGNDAACDWAYGLDDVGDLSLIEAALAAVIEDDADFLEASTAEEAIAAAETLAHVLGRGTQKDAYTEKAMAWAKALGETPSPALRNKARQALQRILADGSELRDLWQESDAFAEWERSVRALQSALAA